MRGYGSKPSDWDAHEHLRRQVLDRIDAVGRRSTMSGDKARVKDCNDPEKLRAYFRIVEHYNIYLIDHTMDLLRVCPDNELFFLDVEHVAAVNDVYEATRKMDTDEAADQMSDLAVYALENIDDVEYICAAILRGCYYEDAISEVVEEMKSVQPVLAEGAL